MTREWQAGDVAMVAVRGQELFCTFYDTGGERGWFHGIGLTPHHYVAVEGHASARPLVVIDAESDADLARMENILEAHGCRVGTAVQAALREFAAPPPPKPEEPRFVGAVVECDPGPVYDHAWAVRIWSGDTFGGKAWDWYDSSGNGGRRHYADLPVLKVLSDGYDPEASA